MIAGFKFHPDAEAFTPKKFCVYALFRHVKKFEIQRPFYIGSGTITRATTSFFERLAESIQVVYTETREDAYKLEAEMIELYLPEQNYVVPKHNGAPARWIKDHPTAKMWKQEAREIRRRRYSS